VGSARCDPYATLFAGQTKVRGNELQPLPEAAFERLQVLESGMRGQVARAWGPAKMKRIASYIAR
jgi:hypothetical protein